VGLRHNLSSLPTKHPNLKQDFHSPTATRLINDRPDIWHAPHTNMGGSESRFIIGHINPAGKVDSYLTVKERNYGSRIVLGPRNTDDRYQKIKLQVHRRVIYIRFDNHPQPGLRAKRDDNTVEMYNASWDEFGEWKMTMTQVKSGDSWRRPMPTDYNLDANNQEQIGKFRAAIFNPAKELYLAVDDGKVVTKAINTRMNNHRDFFIREGFGWEVEYITRAWTAEEVTTACIAPVTAPIFGLRTVQGAVASAVESITGTGNRDPDNFRMTGNMFNQRRQIDN